MPENHIRPLCLQGKVEQIRERLQQYIFKNLQIGDKLPTIRELEANLQASRTTVFSALSGLAAEGCITAMHGSGYFVAQTGASPSAATIACFYQNMSVKGDGVPREYQMTMLIENIQRNCPNLNFRLMPLAGDDFLYVGNELKNYTAVIKFGELSAAANEQLAQLSVPVLYVGGKTVSPASGNYYFYLDNFSLAETFLGRMRDAGHRNCGLISYSSKPRRDFRRYHSLIFGKEPKPTQHIIINDKTTGEPDYKRITQLFDTALNGISAWLLVDEYITNYFIRECLMRDVKIPRDISVASNYYSNTLFNLSPVKITCADIFSYSRLLGREAGKVLKKIVDGKSPRQRNYILTPVIAEGESIGPKIGASDIAAR